MPCQYLKTGLFLVSAALFTATACKSSSQVIVETASHSSSKIEGQIVDEESGKPVSNAKVWVEGTTIAGQTDKSGNYIMEVPAGFYKLDAEKQGYEFEAREIFVSEFRSKSSNTVLKGEKSRTLKPEGLQLSEAERKKKLKKFYDYYINGEMTCRVLNPDDIQFSPVKESGMLRVDPVLLKVRNEELGYLVTVNLKDYVAKSYGEILGVNSDADYYFEELEPVNERQAKEWKKNREKYFKGSLRHFLISMASPKSPLFFGYRLYSGTFVNNTSAMAFTNSQVSDIEVGKDEVMTGGSSLETMKLAFDGELRVEFIERGINDPHNIMGLDSYDNQTSWITLMTNEVEFTNTGTVEKPEQLQIKGVWRYTPVCKMLPADYLPVSGKQEIPSNPARP